MSIGERFRGGEELRTFLDRIRAGDEEGAGRLLRATVPHFLERGALAVHLHLGARLAPATVRDDPRLAVALAWAAGLSGRLTAMGPWLDVAEPRIDEHSPPLEGWCTLRGAAAAVRAFELGFVQADLDAEDAGDRRSTRRPPRGARARSRTAPSPAATPGYAPFHWWSERTE